MANRSTFPTTIDQFVEHYELQSSDKPLVIRFQELKLKPSLTSNESDELANLTTQLRDKLITAEDFNKLQDAITNLETFFRDNVDGYVQQSKSEITVSKDSALASIEQKKENIITYMDSTTAGAIRNDMGVMGDLTTLDKTSLVKAINELGTKTPSDATVLTKGIVRVGGNLNVNAGTIDVSNATTAIKGVVVLEDSVTSTSITKAATPKSVKTAYDLAVEAKTQANDQKTKWASVIGSPLLTSDTSTVLQSKTQTIKNDLATNLSTKGQASVGTETLDALVDKVAGISTGGMSIPHNTSFANKKITAIDEVGNYYLVDIATTPDTGKIFDKNWTLLSTYTSPTSGNIIGISKNGYVSPLNTNTPKFYDLSGNLLGTFTSGVVTGVLNHGTVFRYNESLSRYEYLVYDNNYMKIYLFNGTVVSTIGGGGSVLLNKKNNLLYLSVNGSTDLPMSMNRIDESMAITSLGDLNIGVALLALDPTNW